MSTTVSPQVRMVNEMAVQFPHRTREQAATAIADHIRRFWEPRMRAELLECAASEPDSFDPSALAAARVLQRETE